jgi:hypothetical protein
MYVWSAGDEIFFYLFLIYPGVAQRAIFVSEFIPASRSGRFFENEFLPASRSGRVKPLLEFVSSSRRQNYRIIIFACGKSIRHYGISMCFKYLFSISLISESNAFHVLKGSKCAFHMLPTTQVPSVFWNFCCAVCSATSLPSPHLHRAA